jgi:hypothetical protein
MARALLDHLRADVLPSGNITREPDAISSSRRRLMGSKRVLGVLISTCVAALVAVVPNEAEAVPSFARQTGLSCSACHTAFPQLNAFGRDFKLHGYTMTTDTTGETDRLKEAHLPPISFMLQASHTRTDKAQPGTQNGNPTLPDQASFFYAGRISDKLGAFVQITYDGADDHLGMDNADVRFADEHESVLYGLTLNNNPTVEDPWNSTPAWGFPYAASGIAPAPAAATQVDGTLAQQVVGLEGYVFVRKLVYGAFGVYRSFQIGAASPPDSTSENVIKGAAPYWRLAVSRQWGRHDLEVGTYGLATDLYPGGGPLAGPTNRFRDVAIDAQYQWLDEKHAVTVHTTWIHEKQEWDAGFAAGDAASPSSTLKTFRVDGSYLRDQRLGGSVGYFSITGDSDPLLYSPDSVDGSRTGKPDSRGLILEADYFPWYNTRFSVQYLIYGRFNGADSDYDGFGRNASDNNTLYLNAWLMF